MHLEFFLVELIFAETGFFMKSAFQFFRYSNDFYTVPLVLIPQFFNVLFISFQIFFHFLLFSRVSFITSWRPSIFFLTALFLLLRVLRRFSFVLFFVRLFLLQPNTYLISIISVCSFLTLALRLSFAQLIVSSIIF